MHSAWTGSRMAAAGLILGNAVPLVGVVWFGWNLHTLLMGYWLESAAVGIASVAKILRAEGSDRPEDLPSIKFNDRSPESFIGQANRRVARFFTFHYGAFWVVHGIFVLLFPMMFSGLDPATPRVIGAATLGLVGYHAVSYRINFIGRREFEQNGPVTLMIEPYRRVLTLHVTVVGGAFVVAAVGAPVGALVVMVVVKTVLDFRGHWNERSRAQEPYTSMPPEANVR